MSFTSLGLSAPILDAVAEQGYAACMRGEPVVVPGMLNNLSAATLRRLPDRLRRRIIATVVHRGV